MFDALSAELLEERGPESTRPAASAQYTGAVTDWSKIVSSINDGAAEKLSGITKCSTVMLERGTYGTVSAFFGTWQRTLSAWASDPARAVELAIDKATYPDNIPLTVRSAGGGNEQAISFASGSFGEKHPPLESLYWPALGAMAQHGPAARWRQAVQAAHEHTTRAPERAMAECAHLTQELAALPREGHGLPVARPADKDAFFNRYEAAQPQAPDRAARGGAAAGPAGVSGNGTTCVDSARTILAAKSVPLIHQESIQFLENLVRSNAACLVNWQQSQPYQPPPVPVSERLQTAAAGHAAQRIVRGLGHDVNEAAIAAAASADRPSGITYAHDVLRAPGVAFPSLRLAQEQGLIRERLPVAQFIALARRADLAPDAVHQRRGRAPPAAPMPAAASAGLSPPLAAAPKPAGPRLSPLIRPEGGLASKPASLPKARKKPTSAAAAAAAAASWTRDSEGDAAVAKDDESEHSDLATRKRPTSASKQAETERVPELQAAPMAGRTSKRPVRKTAGINNSSSTKDFLSLP